MKNNLIRTLKFFKVYVPIKRLKDRFYEKKEEDILAPKMERVYSSFIKKGDLVLDIGGAKGERISTFLKIGADKIVFIEPEKYSFDIAKKRFSREKKVIFLNEGISNNSGEETLYVCSSPAFSTFSKQEMNKIKKDKRLSNLEWIGEQKIKTRTLKEIIEKYGLPDFIKIDAEGYETKIFSTLDLALNSGSFEFKREDLTSVKEILKKLESFAEYHYYISEKETMILSNKMRNSKEVIESLKKLKSDVDFGDIYFIKVKN